MSATAATGIYNDLNNLATIRGRANRGDQTGALKQAAKQFEAIFLNMMLKQMRESSFGDPIFDSSAGDSYRTMLDQQLALNLSERGSLGIAKLIENQLSSQLDNKPVANDNPFTFRHFTGSGLKSNVETPIPGIDKQIDSAKLKDKRFFDSVEDFVASIWPYAEKAAQELGVPTETLVSQAALETGWGKHMIADANGKPSFNLFGIKADYRWGGESISVQTTEYREGVVQKERASFRAYESLQHGFDDYVNFLKSSPRYREALNSKGNAFEYLNNLQRGGYATDPAYARKIQGIMQGSTLQSAKAKLDS